MTANVVMHCFFVLLCIDLWPNVFEQMMFRSQLKEWGIVVKV